MTKGDVYYYARIHPATGIYEVDELCIRTVEETYFVGTEKRTKQAFLFNYDELEETVFLDRTKALDLVKAAEAEFKDKKKFTTDYDEGVTV